jgi:hypothetical protein
MQHMKREKNAWVMQFTACPVYNSKRRRSVSGFWPVFVSVVRSLCLVKLRVEVLFSLSLCLSLSLSLSLSP